MGILAQALPWNHIEDHFLHLAFRYICKDIKIFGCTWVGREAAGMCFLHKLLSTIKGGLLELGQTAPSQDSQRESLLGAFPISKQMPVIAEEDKDEEMNTKVIDLANEEQEEEEGDSEGEDFQGVAPDYDEDVEDKLDEETDSPEDTAPKATTNPYHTQESRKQANRLNVLMGRVVSKLLSEDLDCVKAKKRQSKGSNKPRGYFHKINFSHNNWDMLADLTNKLAPFLDLTKLMEGNGPTGSMVIAKFYALKAHLDSRAKELSMGEALLPMISSMQSQKFKKRKKEHNSITNANEITVVSDPATSNSSNSGVKSVFDLFKSQDPEVARDKVTSYLKGTHPMAASDNARDCKAVLPWWSLHQGE
ncbi:uncharacterized protein MELLADRAFT_60767 [Melampsora larici-populina 98AG31]|uniref:Uncharacterized protein n=1 Tax=Melampsora larici-populina (strain 98AG31 / pathotype 3-4-7) TaxID=747676 RepID=F4RC67_MELLP|nr:uncharacterized protein MELLADRAFT_60767 [Melampsora larici-populina 98AG31]EGG10002.1 hypothetical protein MELLADRAFT_60767 [Melampsora larici-populina 98AG31]